MKQAIRLVLTIAIVLATSIGCGPQSKAIPERRPRPVVVNVLTKTAPPDTSLISASVGSWKTEQIGFEVGGRVEFIAEPSKEVEGKVLDKFGDPLADGTPIGRLENERYSLQVSRAEADVTRAEQDLLVAQTELKESIPAQIAAAEASQILAKTEYERSQALFDKQAGAQGDVDRDKANYQNAISQLKQLEAAKKSQAVKIQSLHNAVLQAQQNLRDAKRNLEDCTLYSSFDGQIANVSVVPGSVVTAGQPVATIQMMNPIKVELEVSAEHSRHLQRTQRLPVQVTMPDGSTQQEQGFLHWVDPVADELTRTFTVTLLVINKKLTTVELDSSVPTTEDIWRLDFEFLPRAIEGMLFVEEQALMQDDEGYYLWQVTNATTETPRSPEDGNLLKVRKLRVALGASNVTYLGNWIFQQVTTDDPEFDPKRHMVVGKLNFAEGAPDDWDGDTVMLDAGGQWMLRPGDLVKVDLRAGGAPDGFFVPMDAILREKEQTFIFTIEALSEKTIARKTPIALAGQAETGGTSGMRRITPVASDSLEGIRYVTKGAHYLIDGEAVNPIPHSETSR